MRGGGEDLRRASHESYRPRSSFTIETPERVRKSMDRVRSITKSNRFSVGGANSHGSFASSSKKKESVSGSSIDAPDEYVVKVEEKAIKAVPGVADGLQAAYLLISPLHGWVSTLATMGGSKSGREKEHEPDMKFTVDPTLALFGDDDVFVSAKRLHCSLLRSYFRELSWSRHLWMWRHSCQHIVWLAPSPSYRLLHNSR